MSAGNILENMKQGRTCQDSSVDLVNGRPTGAVRVSVGYMTDPAYAITRLLDFLRHHFLNKTMPNVSQPTSKIYLSSDNEQQESTDPTVFLHSIYVYPIKSCAGDAFCRCEYFYLENYFYPWPDLILLRVI
jgi:molybdenum cofactor sulfurtransferase